MPKVLFVNLKDGRALPFQVPEEFSLDERHHGFMGGGGFLALPDGTELWVDPREFVTAYLVPLNDGQHIALAQPGVRLA